MAEGLRADISRNQNSSNKIRTPDISTCSGSPAVSSNSWDNTGRDPPASLRPHRRLESSRQPAVPESSPMVPLQGNQQLNHAARSVATAAVKLQQSARTNHAPRRRQTFTYLPRSLTGVPSGLRTTMENFPNSIAMSPE
jgi:hypothetical protein